MEFQQILSQRKSVRNFKLAPVPQKDILSIIEAGVCAPTPCNQQLWRFVVVDDEKLKERLITQAYCSTLIRKAASVIVVIYDGWNQKEAIQSGSMAIMNMLNRSWELELGACCINSFGDQTRIKEILNIPDSYVVVSFVILGYCDDLKSEQFPLVDRRPLKEVVSFNGYQSRRDYSKSYDPDVWEKDNLDDYQRYYCRKTFLGKPMDLVSDYELDVIKKQLQDLNGDILDIFSYDGSYLKLFPEQKIYSLNLNPITARYAQSALSTQQNDTERLESLTWQELTDGQKNLEQVRYITMIMKAERVSKKILNDLLGVLAKTVKVDTEFIVIARKKNLFLNAFLFLLRLVFGDDVRKTGIFAFFGPYAPVDVNIISTIFQNNGWKLMQKQQYFFLPAFFQQILQMIFQFYKSGKTSYVHRNWHNNFMTRSYDRLLKFQGLKKTSFGSLVVLKFRLEKTS